MFKKIQNYIFIVIFLLIIAGPMLSWGILSQINRFNPTIMNALDFDLNEKRTKAEISIPIDFSTITNELDAYYNDRLPFRSTMIYTKRYVDAVLDDVFKKRFESTFLKVFAKKKQIVGVKQADVVDGKTIGYMDEAVDVFRNHGLKKSEIDPYDDSIEYPVQYLNNQKVIIGQSNWLYLNEINIPYYLGENKFSTESEIKKYIEPYVKLKNMCDKVNKKLVIFICPEKEEIYPEYMPTMDIAEERERVIDIAKYINENTDITYIYPKEELLKAKKNYLLYKKYDSHWNAIGGYIAANMIKEALGIETIPLRSLSLKKEVTLDADLAYYGNTSVDTLPETFKYIIENYKNDIDYETVFQIDNIMKDSFTTHCKQGANHKVFLVGDSFREEPMRFFAKDFQEFYCNTFLNMSEPFIKEEVKRADDIVILLVERNESIVLPDICKMIYNILSEYQSEYNKIFGKTNK